MRLLSRKILVVAFLVPLYGCWLEGKQSSADARTVPSDAGTIADSSPAEVLFAADTPADFAAQPDVPTDVVVPPAWLACSQDSDCAAVEIGCCDHCNGGKVLAARTDHIGEVQTAFGAKACAGTGCTMRYCSGPAIPLCQQGQCAVGPLASPCEGLGEAACKADAACMPNYGGLVADCAGSPGVDIMSTFLGCSAWQTCGQVISCAISPTGQKFKTGSDCEPAGWKLGNDSTCCGADDVCQWAQPGKLCVRGTATSAGETLSAGDYIVVSVFPKSCSSLPCPGASEARCNLNESGSNVVVSANFCFGAKVSGAGFAQCSYGPWSAGSHTVQMGSLQVKIDVPSLLPIGGACVGP